MSESCALTNLGNCYGALGDFETSMAYYQNSLSLSQSLGDKPGGASVLGNIASLHFARSDYLTTCDYLHRQLSIAQEIKDQNLIESAFTNLGLAYTSLSDFKKAEKYHQQALALAQEMGDREGEVTVLNNLGLNPYLQLALNIATDLNDAPNICKILGNLGDVYMALKKHQQSIDYFQHSLTIARQIHDLWTEALGMIHLGEVYRRQRQFDSALYFTLTGSVIAHGIRLEILDEAMQITHQIHKKLGNSKFKEQINQIIPVFSRERGVDAVSTLKMILADHFPGLEYLVEEEGS
jgi:tetratricopeptide (TPR) repeat protein